MRDPPLTSSDPTLRATGVALTSGPAGALAPRTFLFAEGGGVFRMRISGTATVVPCHDGKSFNGAAPSQLETRVRKKSLVTVTARKRKFLLIQLSKRARNRALKLDYSGRLRALVASPTEGIKTGSSKSRWQWPRTRRVPFSGGARGRGWV